MALMATLYALFGEVVAQENTGTGGIPVFVWYIIAVLVIVALLIFTLRHR